MSELKLAKLPDRTPAKITITVSAELSSALRSYAELYADVYHQAEPVAELIPFMIEAFLESDREFAKARKSGTSMSGSISSARPVRQEPAAAPGTVGKEM